MPDIDFKFDEGDFERIQNRIRNLSMKRQVEIWETGFKNVASLTRQRLVANVSNRILKRRTGTLAKSMQWRVQTTDVGLVAFIGANVLTGKRIPYADILEEGGTITAKGKYLAIPLRAALTKAGTSKMPSPRDFKNTFIQKSRQGNLIIFQALGKTASGKKRLKGYSAPSGEKLKSNIVPLFVLKKSVNIPPKRYMAITLAQMKPRIFQIMNATVSRELNK